VGRPTVVDGEEAALPALLATTPGTAAVLEAPSSTEPSDAAPVAGKITEYHRNRLSAEIDAPAAGVVVIHEAYYPGWTATVDGQAAPIVPANALFRGVAVGPGHHVIAMHYADGRFLLLSVLELVGLAGAGALIWRGARR
jgi:uncharacterized membrane protein YfhO